MINVSMCCVEAGAALPARLATIVAWGARAGLLATPALAHQGSDAYLQLALDAQRSSLRIDVALRDLDLVLDTDANADGVLTGGEIRAGWPAIERYLAARVQVDGCQWSRSERALERRADGVYAALTWIGPCAEGATPPVIRYTALREIDPTHRAIAKIERPGAEAVVRVLDPGAASPSPATPTGAGGRRDSGCRPPRPPRPGGFVREGVHHILTGYDHVLFLLCLLLPAVMRRTPAGWRPVERLREAIVPVVAIVTGFTLAHSATLALAALKLVSLPASFVEPMIAVTIILAAVDNIRPIFGGHRGVVTFLFGLMHGFGFAGVLGEIDLPGMQFAWALLQFNLGIELGQLFIVSIAVSILFLLRQNARYPVWVIRGGSAVAIAFGVLWLAERTTGHALLPFA